MARVFEQVDRATDRKQVQPPIVVLKPPANSRGLGSRRQHGMVVARFKSCTVTKLATGRIFEFRPVDLLIARIQAKAAPSAVDRVGKDRQTSRVGSAGPHARK